jgi:myosin heavy subunit
MNETNTPDNGASEQPTLSETNIQSEPVDCPFYSVLSHNSNQILPPATKGSSAEDNNNAELKQQVFTLNQEQWESKVITSAEISTDDDNSQAPSSDWVAEPDSAKLAAIDAEFQQMLALNHELRAANDELYSRVEEFTSRLAESEKAVQLQQKRYSVTEAMLKQQTQELCATQEQVQSLYQQLENSLQNVQRQETLIETYKAQLEFSQQRLAQLERECALLQTNYSSQSQQLIQSETACKELRTRLMRQQRQTIQFKAALEKCLDPLSPDGDSNDQTCQTMVNDSPAVKKFKSLFINAQPIKPWSVEDDSDFIEQNLEPADTNTFVHLDTPVKLEPTQAADLPEATRSEDSLGEQIDQAIQMYFISQSVPVSEELNTEPGISIAKTNSLNEAEDIWDTQSEEVEMPKTDFTVQQIDKSTIDTDTPITPEIVIEPSSENNSATDTTETEDYWAEVSQLTNLDLPATESPHHPSHNIDDANSPSPVVYPKRPPKGRKSMSSVELPKFPPKPQ